MQFIQSSELDITDSLVQINAEITETLLLQLNKDDKSLERDIEQINTL